MPRFFTDFPPENGIFILRGENHIHISKSLRMRKGENITVCFNGADYFCALTDFGHDYSAAEIINTAESREPSVKVTLFQSLPKGNKLEFIIQKAVELGAFKIVPVLTRRCISRPDMAQFEKKLLRLQKISEAAAKQSGRSIIPEVSGIINLNECIKTLCGFDLSLMLYESAEGIRLTEIDYKNIRSIAVIVGSEGGFDLDEAQKIVSAGGVKIWLGERILRCETAPIAALSIIMALTENI